MLTGTTQILGLMQNLLSVKKGDSTEKTPENASTTVNKGDQLSFSSAALKMQKFLNSEEASERVPEMDLTSVQSLKQRGEMLSQMLQAKINNFQGDFLNQLQSAGIEAEMPIDLHKGIDGQVRVMGEHSQKNAIEQFLQDNEELIKQFEEITGLAGLSQMLRSLGNEQQNNGSSSIASLYARQTQANESSKSGSDSQFQLHIAETGASYTFE